MSVPAALGGACRPVPTHVAARFIALTLTLDLLVVRPGSLSAAPRTPVTAVETEAPTKCGETVRCTYRPWHSLPAPYLSAIKIVKPFLQYPSAIEIIKPFLQYLSAIKIIKPFLQTPSPSHIR
ncbi:hypothetical protein EKO04_009504 [Ascochyta lentis]|uniref:Secreted protein n=1 Tax=Ascochyta lentis TaxID=205686 RepID=A0A8H7MF18_9PLEO|nr:hypothetical protein EKO04_009504 [Ascochyta lentis]